MANVGCGTLTVESAFDASKVSISGCDVPSSSVTPGAQVNASPTIVNDNDVTASITVVAKIDGSEVARTTTDVIPNGKVYGSLEYTAPSSPGTYTIDTEIVNVTTSSAPASAPATAPATTETETTTTAEDTPTSVSVAAPRGRAMTDGGSGCGSCGSAPARAPAPNRESYISASAPGGPVCRAFASFSMASDRRP